ncbi:Acyl-CoA N-acyltransferase [Cordyceps fumosorosea ARSEF 2679]|uniref:Acyl-CoA N-acyltransferase n=1 Tax=Cordyceps fumosorosea (strain ARSEF 2679) TaxID=1081104 RepID=A0A162MLS3_CORFA|nr:Acyl-CoA N-acyltransferase [Cordyceps fumosorosea ARSEF 2679]OAA63880.1 Acyl-CoA N-acyltransferase [Cordyceps fumosorosea ARSEF 2679]
MSRNFCTEVFDRIQVTDDILKDAARLFTENYGIWGHHNGAVGKPGGRVKMTASRLRAECLPEGSQSSYARVIVNGTLAGHAFACRWRYDNRQVCWITQLVVHRDYRERRLATMLLLAHFDKVDEIFGIASSHPAACKTLAKAFGSTSDSVADLASVISTEPDLVLPQTALEYARQHARGVLAASPVRYIKNASLRGSLFDAGDTTGLKCGVDTSFFVDHAEPVAALARVKASGEWPLGDLPDGHEFLLLFDVAREKRHQCTHVCDKALA